MYIEGGREGTERGSIDGLSEGTPVIVYYSGRGVVVSVCVVGWHSSPLGDILMTLFLLFRMTATLICHIDDRPHVGISSVLYLSCMVRNPYMNTYRL